ncbi:hypothetical protein ETAA8_08470 [Anatilimnocola aggregata]|uniref:Tetratricopeptide repeat protein n=1 Tax=Anatilimnocola aggregata TaxID=2528021 RepID=A0A517Y6D7_9BACT|nr:hypothetical protein [Anatilimnocola aggregata]QDU25776.1 hypothetical protein ETAA8_08470 [Anatilimnocola aggregata]
MSRFSRTAFLLACCTPAGLTLFGCGSSNNSKPHAQLAPVRPVAAALPPIREPQLLTVPSNIRPVAGDWMDSSPDAAFRYSERHQQSTGNELPPQRIVPPTESSSLSRAAVPTNDDVRSRLVVKQPAGPVNNPLPRQAGPYSQEMPQALTAPSAPAANPVANFTQPAVAPLQPEQPLPAFRPLQMPVSTQQPVQTIGPMRDRSGFRAVQERMAAMNKQAIDLANRGALFAAREDLLQSLRLAAQSLDAAEGTSGYTLALNQGLTALAEAEDFVQLGANATSTIQVDQVAAGHRTPVLHDTNVPEISPVIAMQRYYGFAGDRLTAAAGELPAAADSLFWLGKVHTGLARQSAQADRLQGPQAMVCFRAALTVTPQHYLAANELGVMLARYGQLQDAKRLLQQSVNTKSHAEGWQNLVIVHRRLNEAPLAQLAEQELIALTGRPAPAAPASPRPPVTWVDPKAFAASGKQTDSWETPIAPNSPAGPLANQPRGNGTRR